MKFCKTCNAYIAEPFQRCPLCQNGLTGEDDLIIFPVTDGKRKRSVLFRIVFYMSVLAIVISVCLDFILGLNKNVHWSILVSIWCAFEILAIAPLFIRLRPIGEVVWNLGFWGCLGTLLTTWYLDAFDILFSLILPIILMSVLTMEFIIIMAEKYTGSMPYFIIVAIGTMLLVLIRTFAGYESIVLLNVALSLAVVLTILLLAIKSDRLIGDIKKKISI